jgi:hypothetical protein
MSRSTSRIGKSILALVMAAGPAFAQEGGGGQQRPVTTSAERGDTVKIIVTGNLILDYVRRAQEVTAYTDSFSNPTGVGTPLTSQSEDTFEGYWAIRFTAELSNQVSVVVEVGTLRVDGSPDASGTSDDQVGIRRYGTDESVPLDLREARLQVKDFFIPGLGAQFGIPEWAFNPRGTGGSMAFDVRHSQTIDRNLSSDGTLNVQDQSDTKLAESAFVDEVHMPLGAVVTMSREAFQFDLVLLPTVNEGGHAGNDESLYAVDFILKLDSLGRGSQIGVIVAVHRIETVHPDNAADQSDAVFYTYGVGGILKLADGMIDVFGEGYIQRGRAGNFTGTAHDIEARGNAVSFGFQFNYTVGNPMPIWAGASFTQISGEDDLDANDQSADSFASYESVADLIVLENPYYGFDWDSNIQVLKIWAGGRVTTFRKDDLEISGIIGFAETEERVAVPTGGTKDDLGTEIDVTLRFHLTKQASIYATYGVLNNSDVLRHAMSPDTNEDASASTQIFVFGMAINF